MANINYWTADNEGPGQYRMIYPAEALASEGGHDVYLASLFPSEQIDDFDLVVGQRVCREGATKFWMNKLSQLPRVFEIDDDLWNVHPSSPAHEYYSREGVQASMAKAAAAADIITVTNEHLAQQVYEACGNENIHILPNFVPESIFEIPLERPDRLTIGWSGGATHTIDAPVLDYPLRRVLKQEDIDFKVTGWNIAAFLNLPHTYTHWTHDIEEHYERLNFHIGLCPLRPNLFNRSKSYLKALEYAARGMIVIASDGGPYDALKDEDWIRVCRTDQDWLKALREFINLDPAAREELSQKALQFAKENTYEKNYHLWEQAYGI